MTGQTARRRSSWILFSLLAANLALLAGCSGKASTAMATAPAQAPATNTGSVCFAKALPTIGEGGLAWGDTLAIARQKSLSNCIRYAGRSGGTPGTCKVVFSECKH
ncbi:hypothetical protein [Pseudomonas sp. GM55]|uniref:hypothetical protein n=1 Tax=Pseudomonas sp. GM55 TaxID=1144333 RepID=UPI0002707F16|nr:hypothetical protein [Pseudomonas sp. GM55]EJM77771.1 hypothetical protein PMI31_00622 [Pseudomonas sp. GM55]